MPAISREPCKPFAHSIAGYSSASHSIDGNEVMSESDRRPIAARETRIAKRLAGWLSQRGVSPNSVSIAGMIAGILAGSLLATTRIPNAAGISFVVAAALIQARLLCNMLDGMIAVERNLTSPVGELYNELPDRISDAAVLIGAGYAAGGDPASGYVAACLAVFTAYVRTAGKAAGGNNEFCGPMAKQQRMAVVTLAALFAASAPASIQPGFDWYHEWGIVGMALLLIIAGEIVTVYRRLVRIARTLRSRSS